MSDGLVEDVNLGRREVADDRVQLFQHVVDEGMRLADLHLKIHFLNKISEIRYLF